MAFQIFFMSNGIILEHTLISYITLKHYVKSIRPMSCQKDQEVYYLDFYMRRGSYLEKK